MIRLTKKDNGDLFTGVYCTCQCRRVIKNETRGMQRVLVEKGLMVATDGMRMFVYKNDALNDVIPEGLYEVLILKATELLLEVSSNEMRYQNWRSVIPERGDCKTIAVTGFDCLLGMLAEETGVVIDSAQFKGLQAAKNTVSQFHWNTERLDGATIFSGRFAPTIRSDTANDWAMVVMPVFTGNDFPETTPDCIVWK